MSCVCMKPRRRASHWTGANEQLKIRKFSSPVLLWQPTCFFVSTSPTGLHNNHRLEVRSTRVPTGLKVYLDPWMWLQRATDCKSVRQRFKILLTSISPLVFSTKHSDFLNLVSRHCRLVPTPGVSSRQKGMEPSRSACLQRQVLPKYRWLAGMTYLTYFPRCGGPRWSGGPMKVLLELKWKHACISGLFWQTALTYREPG